MRTLFFSFVCGVAFAFSGAYNAQAYYRYNPPAQVYRPQVQTYRPPAQVYRPPVQTYRPPPVYHTPVQTYHAPVQTYRPPVQTYVPPPRQNFGGQQPHVGGQPMRPAVVMVPVRPGITHFPQRVVTVVPKYQIPTYQRARWVGGSFVAGAGAYYYFNTGDASPLVPSGYDNNGAAFDIEQFIRILADDGSTPNGVAPDNLNSDELIPE
jgi:hypothetical protein